MKHLENLAQDYELSHEDPRYTLSDAYKEGFKMARAVILHDAACSIIKQGDSAPDWAFALFKRIYRVGD